MLASERCGSRFCSRCGVLLLAFAGNATFTLLSIHRARQGVVANEAYLELQGSVDAAWKSLNDFVPALGRGADGAARPESAAGPAHGAQTPRRRAGRHRPLPGEGAELAAPAGLREQAAADRGAGDSARTAVGRARDGGGRRRSQGALRVREPLRDADPQPEPDAAAVAGRERPDRAAAVRRRGDGAVDGDRAGRGGPGGGRRGAAVHAADAAAAGRAARAGAAGGGRRLCPADRASRRTTRSAIWRASSTRWRPRCRNASSA